VFDLLNSENQLLVTDELVEFEKYLVHVIQRSFRGIYRKMSQITLIKENRKMSTGNRLDLEIQGSRPILCPKLQKQFSPIAHALNIQVEG
jgi:hypothetical protein